MGHFWAKLEKIGKKLPNLAEPDFCQYIHQIIIVIEHYGSFHSENQACPMTRLGECAQKAIFCTKLPNCDQKMAKFDRTRLY